MTARIDTVPFGLHLTRAVDGILAGALPAAHRRLQRKAAVIAAWYLLSFAAVLAAPNAAAGAAACVSLALSMAAVGFNIQHDANHNALFDTGGRKRLSTANRLAGLSINALGGDANRWLAGHVRRHHSAPNIDGRDDDINLAPFGRLAPSQPYRPWYRYQHLYLWPLYSITAVAIFITDITATFGEAVRGDQRPSVSTWVKLLTSKTAFLAIMIGVPLTVHTPMSVLAGAAVVAAAAGILLGVVFQLAHTVEDAEFRTIEDPTDSRWHEWQIRATVDFCHGTGVVSRAVTWFMGGLNYQVEHHLFPTVPHTAYPAIAPVVSAVCAERGVTHHIQPTLRSAVRAHYRHLRNLAAA